MNGPFFTPFLGVALYATLLTLAAFDSGARAALRQTEYLDYFGIAVGVWTLWDAWRARPEPWVPTDLLSRLMAALFAWVVLSGIIATLSGDWSYGVDYRTEQFGQAAIAYFATARGFRSRWHPPVVALPVAAIVLFEAVTNYNRLALDQNVAAFAVLGMPALFMTAASLGIIGLLVAGPLIVAIGAIAAVTRNRGGGLALVALVAMLAVQSRRRWLWAGLVIAAMAFAFVKYEDTGYFSRYRDIFTKGPAYDTVQARLNLWSAGLELARRDPIFGVGPGNYFLKKGADPHSHVVAMLSETGFPGVGLYVGFFGLAVVTAVRVGRNHTRIGAVARASAAGLVAFLVVGAFLGLQTNTLAFMYAGIAHAVSCADSQSSSG
jgi:O-antigen ligase